jgi:tRNA dimethylallyltransferase
MLEKGFVAEVEKLRTRPDLDIDKPSIRALGYRQIWEFLDGKTDYAEMVQRGIIATRQFAKRQLTWLRSEQEVIWLDTLQPKILDRVLLLLNKYCWAHEI